MKYGAIPSNLLEQLALWSGRVPLPLIDALYPLIKCRALMCGVRLGLFEALRPGPLTGPEVAARCTLAAEPTEMVLRVLVVAGYLRQSGRRFALGRLARRSLVSDSPRPMTAFLEWNYRQWEMVTHLEELLRTGRGVDFHRTMTDPADWAVYQRAMLEVARFDVATLAARVPVRRGATRLLDIAGSHGLFGAALCRRHPPMTSTVIELPQALEAARALAVADRITDVVAHRAGDVTTLDFAREPEGPFDVALLGNILHHFEPTQNRDILKRAHTALNPEGTAAIWELETPDPARPADAGDGAALFFRLTSTAASYRGADYAAWLTEAGFRRVRLVRPPLSPGSVLALGRKT